MNRPAEPYKPTARGYLAIRWNTDLRPNARLVATELYSWRDFETGRLKCGKQYRAHIIRNLGFSRSQAFKIVKTIIEAGLLDPETCRFILSDEFIARAEQLRAERLEKYAEEHPGEDLGRDRPQSQYRDSQSQYRDTQSQYRDSQSQYRDSQSQYRDERVSKMSPIITSEQPSKTYQTTSEPRRPDTRERSLEERERIESARQRQAEEEQRRRDQYNAEVRAILNTY